MKPQQNIISLDLSKRVNGVKQVFRAGFSSYAGFHARDKMFIYGVGKNVIIDTNDNQMQLLGHDNTVSTICISNNLYIASGQLASPGSKNYDSQVLLWKIGTRDPIGRLSGLKEGVKALIFSNDGRYLAGVSFKNQFIIWDLKSQTQIYMKLFQNPLLVLSFNNNNIVLVVGKSVQNLSLIPLITQNKPPIYTNFILPSTGLPRTYTCLIQIGAENYILGTQSGQLCIFAKGVFKSATIVGKGKVYSVVSNNGKQYFVAVGNQLARYDLFNDQLKQKQRKTIQPIKTLSINEKGQIFGMAHNSLYSISPDLKFERLKISHCSKVNSVSHRNGTIASIDDEGTIICRVFKNGSVATLNLWSSNPSAGRCIEVNTNGNIIAGFADGKINCLSSDAKKIQWQIAAHKGPVTSIYSSQSYILSGGEDCVVRIWSKTRQLINQLSVHQKTVSRVLGDLLTPNIIHSCSLDKSIQAYDLKNDKKVYFKQAQGGNITDMTQINKTGDLVTCGFGSNISFWKSSDHQPYQSLQTNDSYVIKLGVNQSGSFIAFGHENGLISLFNVKNYSLMGCFIGHSCLVSGICWINQITFITVSEDFSIAIWSIQ